MEHLTSRGLKWGSYNLQQHQGEKRSGLLSLQLSEKKICKESGPAFSIVSFF